MPIEVTSQSIKSIAKNLKSVLSDYSLEIKHSQSLEIISKVFGYRDWNTLSAKLKETPRIPATHAQTGKPAHPLGEFFDDLSEIEHLQTSQLNEERRHNFETAVAGMNFMLIPAGQVQMSDKYTAEITRDFYICDHPVTCRQFNHYLFDIRKELRDQTLNECPVVDINWINAQAYIDWLNDCTGKEIYRLPTEAEWEYASRAGTTTRFSFGDSVEELPKYGWYFGNSKGRLQSVKQLLPNSWGLFDMHGNVSEWVQDYYGDYPQDNLKNPKGPVSGRDRVHRGGGWNYGDPNLGSADPEDIFGPGSSDRNGGSPLEGRNFIGFRLVRQHA